MRENGKAAAAQSGFAPSHRSWTPRRAQAVTVGAFIPALLRPVFEKFGFPAAAILTDWAAIAGPELAAFTAPERLKWPRQAEAKEETANRSGAILVLRVSGARALEVEHSRPRLIERINAAFGYRAVADIRILQAPLPSAKTGVPQSLRGPAATGVRPPEGLEQDRLEAALSRLACGIQSRDAASRRL